MIDGMKGVDIDGKERFLKEYAITANRCHANYSQPDDEKVFLALMKSIKIITTQIVNPNEDMVTVSYPEDTVEAYWEEAEAAYWKEYDEMEAEAELAADDLLALDLEDKLTKTRRRAPFLMPDGWSIEYIWH